jgi:hypothetical protein
MAGSNEPDSKATWKAWVDTQFRTHPKTKQQDLAIAARVGNSAVSKWRKGSNVADPDAAGFAAVFFGRPPVEAMRAAGHHDLLKLLGVGEDEESIKDPAAEEIMSWTYLSVKVRTAILERYRSDAREAMQQARANAALIRDSLDDDESQVS